jgi:hypothetical protein
MRPAWAEADRTRALREAATAWERAGAISKATRDALVARYPDDRVRVNAWFRALLAALAAVAAGGIWVGLLSDSPRSSHDLVSIAFGAILIGLTEVLQGTFRLDRCGAEEATGLLGTLWLAWGLTEFLHRVAWVESLPTDNHFFGLAAMLFVVAFRLWGSPLLAAVSAAFAVQWVIQWSWGRLGCLLAAGLAFGLLELSRKPLRPPRQRTGLLWAAIVLLASSYLALNLNSVEGAWIERWERGWWSSRELFAPAWWIAAAYVGTLLAPFAFWALALRRRVRELLWLALAVTGASAWTFASRFDWLPGWLGLMLGGLVLLGAVFALRRWLAAGPNGERRGFTAEPLYENTEALGLVEVAAVATLPTPQAPERPGFEGQGGQFGGGGASSSF